MSIRILRSARSGIPRRVTAPRCQTRQYSDSLGGPGGQQAPPSKPGGPEAAKRNWVPIAGGALALAAGYAYFTAPKAKVEDAKRKGQAAADDAAALAERVKRDAREQGEKTAAELRGKGGHGPFRAE